MPADGVEQGYDETGWSPIEMIALSRFKEAAISYGMHSLFIQNRIIPQDWKGLVTAILEAGPQLKWLTWWIEEASNIEQGE